MIRCVQWLKRILLISIAALFLYQAWLCAWVLYWKWFNPDITSFMTIRLHELQATQPQVQLKKRWVPYSQISVHLKQAVIASEDGKFAVHGGFDWEGIQHAIKRNQNKGRFVAGGSTITQQLAKNLFLSPTRSIWRKGEEAVITLMIETLWDKQRILEVYLNVIEWGNGVFGAEAASEHYFGIHAKALSAARAAQLAAMVPAPRFYDRNRTASNLNRRATTIQARMPSAQLP